MEIILRQDIEHLGLAYDVVDVKPGFARNYLIPNGMAVLATAKEKENLETILSNLAKEQAAEIKQAQEKVDKLKGVELKMTAKAGSTGKLFGSINNANLSEELEKLGVTIDRKYIKIPGNTVKRDGKYTAKVRLHREVEYDFPFEVIADIEKVVKPKDTRKEKEEALKNSPSDDDMFAGENPLYDTQPKSVEE